MRAVCSGTDGIGCCGWSDMAKPPEITAPTPLSTFRPTHSPTVSRRCPEWRGPRAGLRGATRRATNRLPERPDPDPRSRHVVAEENDHVGFEVVGCGNDVLDPRQRHVGLAGVQIGDDRDPQPQARRPAGRREGIGLQAQEKARLDREGVAADEPEGRPQNPLQDYAATQEANAEVPSGRGAPRSATTSGGTPNRTGRMLVPSPPDTIRWRSSSTTWP